MQAAMEKAVGECLTTSTLRGGGGGQGLDDYLYGEALRTMPVFRDWVPVSWENGRSRPRKVRKG